MTSPGACGDGSDAALAGGSCAFKEAEINGMRTFWQLPGGSAAPRGLLFLAHGACHGAEDFFEEPGFGGLPEEHAIVAAALDRGFLVVAASSTDRARKVWRPNVDGPQVATAVQEVLRRERLHAKLPCYALGASNGGAFVLLLPNWLPLRAVVCQIMALPGELLASVTDLPPVLFVHMLRDRRTAAGVKANVQQLKAMGRVVKELACAPQPVGPTFFKDHCGIQALVSEQMASALQAAGFTDGAGHLLADPRQTNWRKALEPFARALGDELTPDRSPISEVMNVAWGAHEITAEGIKEALDFCCEQGLDS